MKLREIFLFELKYQLSRVSTWLYFLIFLVLTFALVMSFVDSVRNGDYLLNGPVVVGAITSIASILSLLIIAALAGDAATHDVQERVEPLLYTSPLSKFTYLGGRFLGAFAVSALVLTSVPFGLMLASVVPGVDTSLFGPFRLASYLNAYFLVALPNTFVATAILFTAASLSRHALVSFLVGTCLFFVAVASKETLADHMGLWPLAKLLDFSGFTVFGELRQSMSPQELNTRQVGFESWLLFNRASWILVALGVLWLLHFRFRFAHFTGGSWRRRFSQKVAVTSELQSTTPVAVPQVQGELNLHTRIYQLVDIAWRSCWENLVSWGWLAMLGAAGMLLFIGPELLEGPLGVPKVPSTGLVISLFSFFPIQVMVVALITVYAGQIIWRERDARIGDIVDATPVPDWVLLSGKLLSSVLMLVLLHFVFMGAGIIVQVSAGYYMFEPGLYLRVLFGLHLVKYILIAVVALAVHVLVNQKYMANMLAIVSFAFTAFASELGIRHNLLVYGAAPGWTYSDISGFGDTIVPWLWFNLYWAGWALGLVVLTRIFWVRGRELTLLQRARQAFFRSSKLVLMSGAGCILLTITVGAFILYNTNVLNTYYTPNELAARRAAYEQQYGKYRNVLQPSMTATELHIELYPEQHEAIIEGLYTLKNKSSVPMDTIQFSTAAEVRTDAVRFNRKAKLILEDKELGHTIYALEQPLLPNDSVQIKFEVHFDQKGFSNDGVNTSLVENGSVFVGQEWLPAIGYQEDRELSNAKDRSFYGLPFKPSTPSLYDEKARHNMTNLERIRFKATIGTSATQLAVAPGILRRSWTENGRRYFHYSADSPIRTITAFFSAAYAVHETEWNDVAIQIFHYPGHTKNLNRMVQSIKQSLAYYTKHLGPYPHKQLKFVEYAGSGTGATAYPGTIAYTEGFAALDPDNDPRQFDLLFAVVAHEIAHQWWAHQLIPAPVEGAPILSESLAWYSALGVVEKTYGTEHLERLLYAMRSSYLTPRSKADVPLLRATDPFLAYRKGPFAMYMLREYVGQERVNTALRNLLQKHGSGEPPLPTSLDLYKELKAVTPDSLRSLLANLFETNTYWEVKTQEAQVEQLSDGKWLLTLDVLARKTHADSSGVVTEMPMSDMIEIGAFAAGKDGYIGKQIYMQKHLFHSGKQQLTVMLTAEPALAGIDPRSLLIDVKPDDNLKKVSHRKPREHAGPRFAMSKEVISQFVRTCIL